MKTTKQLTDLQLQVTKFGATEPPFNNQYYDNFKPGIYIDIISEIPLFISTDKFESGCGWPAFSRPIDNNLLIAKQDDSFGMSRTEVIARQSQSHLGHVFNDGPTERGGIRYCINSAALEFIAQDQMEARGYGQYLKLLD